MGMPRHLLPVLSLILIATTVRRADAQTTADLPTASPIGRLDHVMFLTTTPSAVVALLADTLRLPLVWPTAGNSWPGSSGLSFGNVILEVMSRPADAPSLSSLALQARDWASLETDLQARGIEARQPAPGPIDSTNGDRPRWTLRSLAGLGRGVFVVQYHQFDMGERHRQSGRELASRAGGPLGVLRVREVIVAAESLPARAAAWSRLFGAGISSTPTWFAGEGPRITVVDEDNPRRDLLSVEVRALSSARKALDSLRIAYAVTPLGLRVDPGRMGGLRLLIVEASANGSAVIGAQSAADPDADLQIVRPAFTSKHPKVLFDEAHFNVHTSGGRYRRFADLITADGYVVTPNKEQFSAAALARHDVLVIVSALGANRDTHLAEAANPAFTIGEADVVRDWVRQGGRLLLITDHEPTGAAAQILAQRFGVDLRNGVVSDSNPANTMVGCPACLYFTRANGLLGDHAITRGRDHTERITGVATGVGLSLKGPDESASILQLGKTTYDEVAGGSRVSAAGRSQGIAFAFGKGRVVVLGEAALISGQDTARPGYVIDRWGRHEPGIDARQFALNIMHWLSGLMN
jgi:hypothetical protein